MRNENKIFVEKSNFIKGKLNLGKLKAENLSRTTNKTTNPAMYDCSNGSFEP